MRFESTQIQDLKVGNTVNGIYVLRKKELKTTSSNKFYLDLLLMDKTGEINGKIWDADETFNDSLVIEKLYYINARVDSWKESLQLNINKIKLADDEDQKKIMFFVPSAPLAPGEMIKIIYEYLNCIKNKDIFKLVQKLLSLKEENLMYYPAAKSLHHSVMGGLLFHLVRMLRTAEKLKEVYTSINTDLLYAGIILHDLAKIGELDANSLGFSEYSKEGQLLGHIVMGVRDVDRIGRELGIPDEILILIEHMITSHHYEAEFGSPKKPMILEAELLHYIDIIDARVYDYDSILQNIKAGDFSEPVWSLDRRRIYKYNLQS